MFYFIFTEILPATAILFVFRKRPHHDTRSSPHPSINQYTPLKQPAAPSYADAYLPNQPYTPTYSQPYTHSSHNSQSYST
jgi:hypothetical protein